MKASQSFPALLLLALPSALGSAARADVLGAPFPVDRGPHQATWGRTPEELLPDGRAVLRTNTYVTLAAGMHYFEDGS